MSADDVMDEDTFYNAFADSDIQLYLFEPEYTAKDMQRASDARAQCTLVHEGTADTAPRAGELSFLSQ